VVGTAGGLFIVTCADGTEVHPLEFVTVNVYDPATRPVTVAVVVEPVIFPGLIVQLPAGRSFSTTLPVDTVQVG
jgi:hypothetical protein